MPVALVGDSSSLEVAWNRAKDAASKTYKTQSGKYWGAVNSIFHNMVRGNPKLVSEYERVHGKPPEGARVSEGENKIVAGTNIRRVVDDLVSSIGV